MKFLSKNCFELLLVALLCHLYGSLFFSDLNFYGNYVRTLNTFFLYFAATNSFFHGSRKISAFTKIALLLTLLINLITAYVGFTNAQKQIHELAALAFLILATYNTASFLLAPNRFDRALLSAAVVGYLLLIEVAVRLFLLLFLRAEQPLLSNIDYGNHSRAFIDTTYFCTVTITSIGFGDVLPLTHQAKMLTSLLGVAGQLYLVIIMSIMVSKFTASRAAG